MWFWKSQTQEKLDELLEGQKKTLRNQRRLSRNQLVLDKKLDALTELVCDLLLKGKPGPVTISITGERREAGMADKILFSVNLPAKAAPDVASRELTVVIGGGEPDVKVLDAEALLVEGLEGDQDATVELSLVDIDDGGNRSEASTASAVLADTVAPPQPGALGIQIIGEEHEEPAEEPPAEEPPAEEPPVDPAV